MTKKTETKEKKTTEKVYPLSAMKNNSDLEDAGIIPDYLKKKKVEEE